ncbi:MAG: hypothetical protein IPH03_17210 [Tetrasphaera sp.]|nr:hypothetical protein [Tetrasphaera sp.]
MAADHATRAPLHRDTDFRRMPCAPGYSIARPPPLSPACRALGLALMEPGVRGRAPRRGPVTVPRLGRGATGVSYAAPTLTA